MKRTLITLFLILTLLASCAASLADQTAADQIMQEAVEVLKAHWTEEIYPGQYSEMTDGYLAIRNARIIHINHEAVQANADRLGSTYFSEIDSIIEFDLYSDYFFMHPYYTNVKMHDCVLRYMDGHMEAVRRNPLENLRAKTYDPALCAAVVLSVDELGTAYNADFYLSAE